MPTLSKTPMPPNVPDLTVAHSIDARRDLAGAWGGMKQGWGGAHQRTDVLTSQ